MNLHRIARMVLGTIKESFYSTGVERFEDEDTKRFIAGNDALECYYSSIPEDEEVALPCLWSCEVYTADNINNLLEGVKRFKSQFDIKSQYEDSIIKQRESNCVSSWHNLGYFVAKNNQSIDFDLFKGVHFYVYQLTSSITILLCCFELHDDGRNSYYDIINDNYKTYIKIGDNNSREYISPIKQKQYKVIELRKRYIQKCSRFINNNFPGFFSSHHGYHNPCSELLVVSKWDGPGSLQDEAESYINVLGLRSFDLWGSEHVPFYVSLAIEEKGIHYNVFIVNNNALSKEKAQFFCGDNLIEKVAQFFLYEYKDIFYFLSLYCYVHDVSRRMGEIKELTGNIRIDKDNTTLIALTNSFYNFHNSVSLSLGEIENDLQFDFIRIPKMYDMSFPEKYIELKDIFVKKIKRFCKNYRINEKFVSEALNNINLLMHSRASLKLSRSNRYLQIVIALLTAVMLVATLMEIPSINTKITNVVAEGINYIVELF